MLQEETEKLFVSSSVASDYQRYRPGYPAEIYKAIKDYIKLPQPFDQAVDVGCGSGQFTSGLSPNFDKILGIDISLAQIDQANQNNTHSNTSYRVGSFDDIPLPDKSCELVSTLDAAHWFEPRQKFFAEADRILKPGGCLCVGSHTFPSFHFNDGTFDEAINTAAKMLLDTVKLYRLPGNNEVADRYKDWILPYLDSQRRADFAFTKKMSLADVAGYFNSLSYFTRYKQKNPDKEDPVQIFMNSVLEEMGHKDSPDELVLTTKWPIFLLICTKPSY